MGLVELLGVDDSKRGVRGRMEEAAIILFKLYKYICSGHKTLHKYMRLSNDKITQ